MAHINLLPYREKRKKEAQREFAVMVAGSAIIVLAVVGAIHMNYVRLLDNAKDRNQYMKDRIKEVEKEIKEIETLEAKKEALLARMRIIQKLQSARPEIVHLFYDAAGTLPDGVFLTKVTRKGEQIEVQGIAESNANVSELMRNLDSSDWMTKSELIEVIADKREEGYAKFKLTVRQERPVKSDDKNDAGAVAAPAKGEAAAAGGAKK